MAWYHFSKAAAANAGADPTQNWAEGMAPSAVNDSARALLAASAAYRDDVAGATVTTGTSAAYALSTFSNFTSAAYMAGQLVAFTPHVTNATGPVTLTVDSQANIPLRSSPGKELQAGVLIQGTPYCCVYNQADNALYLQGFYGNPYNVPLGASMEFWGSTAPNSSFAFPNGQAISRTTYAALFAMFGTGYGVGDGSTTFNIPDCRGRVVASADNMGGTAAGRLTSASGMGTGLLGQTGGAETHTLTIGEMPAHTHANTLADPGHVHNIPYAMATVGSTNTSAPQGGSSYLVNNVNDPNTNSATTGITLTNNSQGGGGAHPNIPPAIIANRILRII